MERVWRREVEGEGGEKDGRRVRVGSERPRRMTTAPVRALRVRGRSRETSVRRERGEKEETRRKLTRSVDVPVYDDEEREPRKRLDKATSRATETPGVNDGR
jgi:hypothetical protein